MSATKANVDLVRQAYKRRLSDVSMTSIQAGDSSGSPMFGVMKPRARSSGATSRYSIGLLTPTLIAEGTRVREIGTQTLVSNKDNLPPVENFIKLNKLLAELPYNAALNRSALAASEAVQGRDRARIETLLKQVSETRAELEQERARRKRLELELDTQHAELFRNAYLQARALILTELRQALTDALTLDDPREANDLLHRFLVEGAP
ncbi:hypothetical protein GMRT_10167 [Giardia muris]|uniref:Uncharacterized protein n=1 Tax=Giardia muris TaxID=5742 RepID=A0A4Z1SM60_GIAMU|nr:hypothetical protein GMRT_10167 [Giardia muris]|eukprot:TNJ26764.1 hypothetical protein GMRT_10167 [Giardia muris]